MYSAASTRTQFTENAMKKCNGTGTELAPVE